ncbi:hypothetical protein V8C34DRAFT_280688 [Trichoderma compactum]
MRASVGAGRRSGFPGRTRRCHWPSCDAGVYMQGCSSKERTISCPFSGSCLEFWLPCPCSARISLRQASRNSSESMSFTKYGNECVVGETCIMLVDVPFFSFFSCPHYSVVPSHHNPGCFFYPLSTLYSYEYVQLCFRPVCRPG